MKQLSFTSDKFSPEPGEEEKTNPGLIGKQLAEWLRQKLIEKGRNIEEGIIPEDWGWVVMVQRKPVRLWIGCGNEDGSTERWKVFVETEPGFLQKLLKNKNAQMLRILLQEDVEQVIKEEPTIHNVVWEEA